MFSPHYKVNKLNVVSFPSSFPDCYAAKFSPLQLGNETLEGGVSLEHLITCVPSITIVTAQNGFKVIKWIHNKPPAPNSGWNIHKPFILFVHMLILCSTTLSQSSLLFRAVDSALQESGW